MKMYAYVTKRIEVESFDPIFKKLFDIHAHNGVAEPEQYEEACRVFEELTGLSCFSPDIEFDESVTGVYEANTDIPILEM